MTATDKTIETSRRLIEAAGEVFAEHGFQKATIREICSRAGTNVAAVNYHFRDKTGLYRAVLRYWSDIALAKYPPNGGVPDQAPAEQRLAAFVRSFLFRILDEGRPAWHGRLLAREMTDPTPVFDELVEQVGRPLHDRLTAIVRELLGPNASSETVRHATFSILGQCLFYHHCRPVTLKLHPEQRYDPASVERLAEHITRFSIGGLQHLARNPTP